jgi:hypothetical protein
MRYKFWKEFFSGDNSKVNTMAVVSIFLAAPIVTLSLVALVYHIFYLHKGLDSPSVQLLVALITASTGGLAGSMYARSTFSTTRLEALALGKKPIPPPRHDNPAPKPDSPDATGET